LRSDRASYLALEPDWQPTLPTSAPPFTMADLIALG